MVENIYKPVVWFSTVFVVNRKRHQFHMYYDKIFIENKIKIVSNIIHILSAVIELIIFLRGI